LNLDLLRDLLASLLASDFPHGGRTVDLAARLQVSPQQAAQLMRSDARFVRPGRGFWCLAPTPTEELEARLAEVTYERDLLAAEAAEIAYLVEPREGERLVDAVARRRTRRSLARRPPRSGRLLRPERRR